MHNLILQVGGGELRHLPHAPKIFKMQQRQFLCGRQGGSCPPSPLFERSNKKTFKSAFILEYLWMDWYMREFNATFEVK